MSARTSRPRVTGVTVNADGRSTNGASALSGLLSGLSAGARAAYQSLQETRAEMEKLDAAHHTAHRPLCAIRQERAAQPHPSQVQEDLPEMEAAKVEVLQRAASYRIENSSALEVPMRALRQADTPAEASLARDEVMSTLEAEHHRLFTERLVSACTRASVKAGFPTVETQTPPDGLIRVVATNAAGHALVSEVEAAPGEEPSLATEVVGVRDGSCNNMLDAFDEALEAEGVRAATPRRTFTGGVCELAAAKAFVQRKVRAGASSKSENEKAKSEKTGRQKKARRQRRTRRGRSRQR